jgi:hypothetical protein
MRSQQASQRFLLKRRLHKAHLIPLALASRGVYSTCHNLHGASDGSIGYSGDSLSLKIIIAFLLGLALYNAIELIVLILVTFQRYHGLYFWSLVVATFGIIPYSLGFLIKFFQLLDPSRDVGYVAVFFLSIGWYPMVTGHFSLSLLATTED